MEAVASASALLGLVTFALHSNRILIEQIERIHDAPEEIECIRIDLQALIETIESLNIVLQGQNLDSLPVTIRNLLASTSIKNGLKSCQEICDAFSKKLSDWTKHSTADNTMAKRDQLKIGLFGDSKIKTFRTRLSTCKSTITMVLTYMTFILSIDQASAAQTRSTGLQQQQIELQNQAVAVDQRAQIADASLQQLILRQNSGPASHSSQAESRISEDVDELRNELALLRNEQNMIATILYETQNERARAEVNIVTGRSTTTTGGKAVVGVFGSQDELKGTNHNIMMETFDLNPMVNSSLAKLAILM